MIFTVKIFGFSISFLRAGVNATWESVCWTDLDADEVWVMPPSAAVETHTLWGLNLGPDTGKSLSSSLQCSFLSIFKVKCNIMEFGDSKQFFFEVLKSFQVICILVDMYSNLLINLSQDSVWQQLIWNSM